MIRWSVQCLTVAVGLAWLACGGSEVSQQPDGGTQTGSAGSSTSTGSTGSTTGSTATGTGGAGGDTTGAGGGTSGSGGTTSGSGGSGGQPGDASQPDAPPTCPGTVTFQFTAASGNSSDWCVGANCSDTWVTITTSAGQPVTTSFLCGVDCSTCRQIPCPPPACRLPQPMKAQGETTTWNGTYWQDGSCGANMSCKGTQCAAPGHYIAKMCASRSMLDAGTFGQCNPNPMQTCVEVPFDYPTSSVVAGKVN